MQSRIDDIQKNFDRLNNIIIACIGIPLAIIAVGATGYISTQAKHKRSQTRKVD